MRLALSNDDLKMMSIPYFLFSLTNSCATVSSSGIDSMTQGPAMKMGFMSLFFDLNHAKVHEMQEMAKIFVPILQNAIPLQRFQIYNKYYSLKKER